jgi:hypothetical protein
MHKPNATEYGTHLSEYVQLVQEGKLFNMLKEQIEELQLLLAAADEELGNFRYAPDKWSLKEVIGHMSDTERIMSYRALRIARGDSTPLPGFEEKLFVQGANFEQRTIKQLLAEMRTIREATLYLIDGFTEEAWQRSGNVSNHLITVRALVYVIAGHWQHHRNVIEERYLLTNK